MTEGKQAVIPELGQQRQEVHCKCEAAWSLEHNPSQLSLLRGPWFDLEESVYCVHLPMFSVFAEGEEQQTPACLALPRVSQLQHWLELFVVRAPLCILARCPSYPFPQLSNQKCPPTRPDGETPPLVGMIRLCCVKLEEVKAGRSSAAGR